MLEQPTTHMVKGHVRIHVCLAWDKFQVVKDVKQTEKNKWATEIEISVTWRPGSLANHNYKYEQKQQRMLYETQNRKQSNVRKMFS